MKISTTLTKLLLCLPLAAVLLSSCVSSSKETPVAPSNSTEAIFNMTIPGNSATRALTETDEYKVSETDVIVFNSATGELLYTAYGLNTIVQPNNTTVRFTVRLHETSGVSAYDFMIVANARTMLGALSSLSGTITKTDVQAALLEQVTAGTGWVATPSLTGYKDMPMWGELNNQVIAAANYAATLTRMTAKADVEVDLSGASSGDSFLLKEVWLYNYNSSGYLVPAAANWGAPSSSEVPAGDDLHARALRPTVPSGVLQTGTATAIDYTSAISSDELSLTNCIYLFEAAAGSTAAYMNNTCLVIRADWTPAGGTTQSGWYRMDFANTNMTTLEATYLPLRRNHRYNMKITRISGPGYGSKEEAYNSLPANIINGVVEWDEAGLGSQTTDGQYTLSAPDELTFYAEGTVQTVRIYTDNPNGWKVQEKSAWITLSPDQSTTEYTDVAISCDPMSLPNTDRAGYFVIEVGRIRKTVRVNQLAEPDLTLDVDRLFLNFKKTPSVALPIQVTTYPAGVPLYFSASGTIDWETNISSYDGSTDAASPFYFKPNVNTTGNTTLSSIITISAILDDKIVSKSISVTQSPYDLAFTVTAYNPYPAAGGVQKIAVLSEPDWYVSSITNNTDNIISSWSNTTVTGNAATEYEYNFTLAPNPTFAEREATFNFNSPSPDFPGVQTVTIRQGYTNPSISVNPTSFLWRNPTHGNQPLTVTSNAQWQYTASGQWDEAVSSVTLAAGTTQGVQDAQTQTGTAMTFVVKPYNAESGTPAAGTSYTAYADFAAVNLPAGVPAATARLSITRTVPAHWTWMSGSSKTAPRAGGNISVTAETNAWWGIQVQGGGVFYPCIASAYGSKTITGVAIPENTAWSTTTSPVNTPRYTWVYYKNADGSSAGDYSSSNSGSPVYGTFIIYQPGYYISAASTNMTSAPSASSSNNYTISLTGAFPTRTDGVRAFNTTSNVGIWGGTVAGGESGTRSANVTVPANTTWSPRTVQMQYYHPGTGQWTNIGSAYTQQGYSISFSAAGTPVGSGFNVTVTGNGYAPQLQLRCAVNNAQISGSSITNLAAAGSGNRTQTVRVPNNPSTTASRVVQIQYLNPRNNTWTNITTYTQPAGNIVLSSGRIVAKMDVGATSNNQLGTQMNWAQAMGISTSYNTAQLGGVRADIPSYTPTANTGCNSYYENSDQSDKGQWRIPTKSELASFIHNSNVFNPIHQGSYYWSTNNFDTHAEIQAHNSSGNWIDRIKTGTSRARCVRAQ